MRRRGIIAFFAAAVSLMAAGCDNAGPEGDTLFPLAEGRSWTYRFTTDFQGQAPFSSEITFTTHGEETVKGESAWRRRADSGFNYWLKSNETGIFRVAHKHALDAELKVDPEPRYVLKAPFVVGTEWENTTTSYVLQRRNEVPKRLSAQYPSFKMNYRIAKTNVKVTTEAGEFDGCLEVVGLSKLYLFVDNAFGWQNLPLTTTEWYCPNIGLVRLERAELSPSRWMLGGKKSLELIDWN